MYTNKNETGTGNPVNRSNGMKIWHGAATGSYARTSPFLLRSFLIKTVEQKPFNYAYGTCSICTFKKTLRLHVLEPFCFICGSRIPFKTRSQQCIHLVIELEICPMKQSKPGPDRLLRGYSYTHLRVATLEVLNQGLEWVVASSECSIEKQRAVVGIMRLDYPNGLPPVDVCHVKLAV